MSTLNSTNGSREEDIQGVILKIIRLECDLYLLRCREGHISVAPALEKVIITEIPDTVLRALARQRMGKSWGTHLPTVLEVRHVVEECVRDLPHPSHPMTSSAASTDALVAKPPYFGFLQRTLQYLFPQRNHSRLVK